MTLSVTYYPLAQPRFTPCYASRMSVKLMDIVAVLGAVAAILAALFGFFNNREISYVRGKIDTIERTLNDHVNTPHAR